LPKGIVQDKSNFEMEPLGGNPERRAAVARPAKSLLAIPVGIKQKAVVDKLVSKVPIPYLLLQFLPSTSASVADLEKITV
jgi:hypothetical protein